MTMSYRIFKRYVPRNWANRSHRRKPAQSCATDKTHKESLGLVVHRMPGRNAITARLRSHLPEEVITNVPCRFLDSSPPIRCDRANIYRANGSRNAELPG